MVNKDRRTPAHDQSSADSSGGVLSGVDRHGGSLGTHTDTQENTTDKKLCPCLSTGSAEDRPEAKVRSREDGSYDE